MDRLGGFTLLLFFAQLALWFTSLFVAAYLNGSHDSAGPYIVAALAFLAYQAFSVKLSWTFRGRAGSLETKKAPALPTARSMPPSDQWARLATRRGKDKRSGIVMVVGAAALAAILAPLPYLHLLVHANSATVAVVYNTWMVVSFTAAVAMVLLATRKLGPTLARLGREEYMNATRSVMSPALEKAVDLNRLARELRERSVAAERIVAEVDALFEDLNKVTRERERELSHLVGELEAGQSLQQLTQSQRDDLRALLGQESRQREQRGLFISIFLAIFSAAIGYALSLVYPVESVRKAFFP